MAWWGIGEGGFNENGYSKHEEKTVRDAEQMSPQLFSPEKISHMLWELRHIQQRNHLKHDNRIARNISRFEQYVQEATPEAMAERAPVEAAAKKRQAEALSLEEQLKQIQHDQQKKALAKEQLNAEIKKKVKAVSADERKENKISLAAALQAKKDREKETQLQMFKEEAQSQAKQKQDSESPFARGFLNSTTADMPQAEYKDEQNPYATRQENERNAFFNKRLKGMSGGVADQIGGGLMKGIGEKVQSVVGGGQGGMRGIAGLGANIATNVLLPKAWNKVKNHFAQTGAEQDYEKYQARKKYGMDLSE